jgi:hypothetical protein
MKKVYQTIFGVPNGNCFQACIASILECELKDLPNFMEDGPDSFGGNLKEWESVMPFKLFDVRFDNEESRDFSIKDLVLIATIDKMYGDDRAHSVIMKNGKIIHDPMPGDKRSNRKISEPIYYTIFIPKEPQKHFDIKKINSEIKKRLKK